jgi:hypothetical protein
MEGLARVSCFGRECLAVGLESRSILGMKCGLLRRNGKRCCQGESRLHDVCRLLRELSPVPRAGTARGENI